MLHCERAEAWVVWFSQLTLFLQLEGLIVLDKETLSKAAAWKASSTGGESAQNEVYPAVFSELKNIAEDKCIGGETDLGQSSGEKALLDPLDIYVKD